MDSRFDLILQGIHDSKLFGFFLISNYKKGFWTEQAEYPCVDFKKEKLGLTKKTKNKKQKKKSLESFPKQKHLLQMKMEASFSWHTKTEQKNKKINK